MAFAEPRDTEALEEYEDKQDNKLNTSLKGLDNRWIVVMFILVVVWLVSSGRFADSNKLIWAVVIFVAFLLLKSSVSASFTDRKTAEGLARDFIKRKQKENAVVGGAVHVNGKGKLTEIPPRRHLVGVDVTDTDGIINEYVVSVDAERGWKILGFYEVPEGYEGREHVSKHGDF